MNRPDRAFDLRPRVKIFSTGFANGPIGKGMMMFSKILRSTRNASAVTSRAARVRRTRSARLLAPEPLEDRLLLSAGDLDPTYGSGGTASIPVSAPAESRAYDVLAESDGKIVAVGSYVGSGPSGEFVARFNADGSPDSAFGKGGQVLVPNDFGENAGLSGSGLRAALEGDTIVLAGETDGHVALLRLNADGSADTTFGGGTAFTGVDFAPAGLSIQEDGKILVVGPERTGNRPLVLARFNADGTLDTSFGVDGEVVSSLYTTGISAPIAVQGDGSVVVAGSDGTSPGHLALERYHPDGSLDTSFGPSATGEVVAPGQPAVGLVLQPAGIVAVSVDLRVTRFTPSGSLDPSFVPGPSFGLLATAPSVQADGKILVGGVGFDGPDPEGILVRYNADGTLDTTFGSNGVLEETANQLQSRAQLSLPRITNVATQIDGKIVAGCWVVPDEYGPLQRQYGLVRYNPDGTRDTTFGDGGLSLPPVYGPGIGATNAIALQPDGDAVVAGAASDDGTVWCVARFRPDGTPDPSFGVGGVVYTSFDDPVNYPQGIGSAATGLSILPDGRILVVGTGGAGIALARYNPDGSLDTTFGTAGKVSLAAGGSFFAVQSDGKILLMGGGGEIDLTRLNADGSLDTTFGEGGSLTTPYPDGMGGFLGGIAVQSDDKIVVDGSDGDRYFVARFGADGTLDTSFGGSGWITGSYVAGNADEADSIAVQPNGQILVPGDSYDRATGIDDFVLARYNADGTLDASFGVGGYATVASPPLSDGFFNGYQGGLLVQPDGRLVAEVFGAFGTASLARFNADGSLDSTFGQGGIADGGPGSSWNTPGAALQVDGDVVVAANLSSDTGLTPLAVMRFQGDLLAVPGLVDGPTGFLQSIVTRERQYGSGDTVTLQAASDAQVSAAIAAVNGLTADTTHPITVMLDLGDGTYHGQTASPPAGVTLVITAPDGGATFVGHSPALTVTSGTVIVSGGVTFTDATDAPTILVTGGSLTVRNSTIEESTAYDQVAILVTGGTVDLGTAADPGNNAIDINGAGALARDTGPNPISAVGTSFTVGGTPVGPSSLSGVVFEDFNDDGQVDFGEAGIAGVTINLDGTDFLGNAVHLSQQTDTSGTYIFLNLAPGSYTISEPQQPAGYTPGHTTVGAGGGTVAGSSITGISLAPGQDAMNDNFGERPAATGQVHQGQTAGIGFWNNRNGQALILALNGGTGTQLGDWLAATFPHMFGAQAGPGDLAGQGNASVAAFFQKAFVLHGEKLDAQVLATALAVYVTDPTLDSTGVGTKYGFLVGGNGAATATINVGSSGAAFAVANNTVMTVLDVLLAADAQAVNGVLYNGDTTKRSQANNVFSAINQAGGL